MTLQYMKVGSTDPTGPGFHQDLPGINLGVPGRPR